MQRDGSQENTRHKLFGIVTNMDWEGDRFIRWHHARCGTSEEAHSVMKEDLAEGNPLPGRVMQRSQQRASYDRQKTIPHSIPCSLHGRESWGLHMHRPDSGHTQNIKAYHSRA